MISNLAIHQIQPQNLPKCLTHRSHAFCPIKYWYHTKIIPLLAWKKPCVIIVSNQFLSFQFMTSSPATSPNISISGSNMSPICSEEGPSVSPPLPPRLPTNMSDPGARVPPSLTDPSQFLSDPSNLAALSYPRLGAGMMGLGTAMPTLPYSSSEQSPYSSISMESFYNPLVRFKFLLIQFSTQMFNFVR